MRARLIVVIIVPLVVLFAFLGAAYGRSLSLAAQQELYVDRLSDTSYFVGSARQGLRTDDPVAVESELERYREVYGVAAAVLDRSGEPWAAAGLDLADLDDAALLSVSAAMSGRQGEPDRSPWPWDFDDLVIAEPITDAGDLIGVVVTASSTDRVSAAVLRQWLLLAFGGFAAMGASLFLVARLANWVLRPLRRVDSAMTEMWHGHMEARVSDTTGPPELRRVIAVFNSMAEEVEQLIQRQQEFVSNASHELRNPLNALILRIEHLGLGLGAEWSDEVEAARAEGRRMARILDTLLQLARGQEALGSPVPVELLALAERRVEAWKPVSRARGVDLTVRDRGAVHGLADEIVIESAFDVVLDNAIKFSPPGSLVEVTVSVENDVGVIAVRDHGPGVQTEELGLVTERFWRSPSQRYTRGSGLGLALATEFLTACGGELDVAPADSGGLVVSLLVPAGGEAP